MKQPQHLDEAFATICEDMRKTFVKKHQEYGKGNILSIKELGISFRLAEKVERLKNLLLKGKKAQNESIDDTWMDIAVYAVIGLMFKKGWFQKLKLKKSKK